MESKPARPFRSIDDPRPAPWRHVAMHAVRQSIASSLLPSFRTGRRRFERLAATGDLDLLASARHVAVVHWENLGDAVILSAFLRELRRNLPAAELTLVHNAATAALFELCPYVDRMLAVEVRSAGLERKERSYLAKMWSTARLLRRAARETPIDLVVGPDWLDTVSGHTMWDNLLARRAAGPVIIEARARVGLDVEIGVRQHHVPRTLRVLEVLGGTVEDDGLELWLGEDDEQAADDLVGTIGPFAALAPGASLARRCWPPERFAELAASLGARGLSVVVLGSAVDRERPGMTALLTAPHVIDAMGPLSLRVSAAVIGRADVFIGNDSGPAHLAAAAGTAAVVVSAHPRSGEPWMFNSPMRYRPWGVPSEVLQPASAAPGCDRGCAAAEPHCITGVSVDDVCQAVQRVLTGVCP